MRKFYIHDEGSPMRKSFAIKEFEQGWAFMFGRTVTALGIGPDDYEDKDRV